MSSSNDHDDANASALDPQAPEPVRAPAEGDDDEPLRDAPATSDFNLGESTLADVVSGAFGDGLADSVQNANKKEGI